MKTQYDWNTLSKDIKERFKKEQYINQFAFYILSVLSKMIDNNYDVEEILEQIAFDCYIKLEMPNNGKKEKTMEVKRDKDFNEIIDQITDIKHNIAHYVSDNEEDLTYILKEILDRTNCSFGITYDDIENL